MDTLEQFDHINMLKGDRNRIELTVDSETNNPSSTINQIDQTGHIIQESTVK